MRRSRTALTFIPLAAGLMLMATQPAESQGQRWTYYSVITQEHVFGAALVDTFERISERTDGALEIDFVSYGETPHNSVDALQILQDGLVEMSEWIPAYTTGTFPILGAPGLPFLPPERGDTAATQANADAAWDAPAMVAEVDGILDRHGARELGSYYYEPMNFYFTSEVNSLDDFAGKRIRVFSPELSSLVQELSGSPVSLPAPEVYAALQRGVLDGVVTSSGGVTGLQWHEQLNSTVTVNMLMVKTAILVREDALAGLDDEVREILIEEMMAVGTELRNLLNELDARHHGTMRELGYTFTDGAGEIYGELRELSRDRVWPAWSERIGPVGQGVLDDLLTMLENR